MILKYYTIVFDSHVVAFLFVRCSYRLSPIAIAWIRMAHVAIWGKWNDIWGRWDLWLPPESGSHKQSQVKWAVDLSYHLLLTEPSSSYIIIIFFFLFFFFFLGLAKTYATVISTLAFTLAFNLAHDWSIELVSTKKNARCATLIRWLVQLWRCPHLRGWERFTVLPMRSPYIALTISTSQRWNE